jgi:hypothetical protein
MNPFFGRPSFASERTKPRQRPTGVPVGEVPVDEIDLGPLGPEFALTPSPTSIATPQGARTDLAAMLRDFPNLEIAPFPHCAVVALLTANQARELVFPNGTALFRLSSNGNFYACASGNAEIPTAGNEFSNRSIWRPVDQFFFTMANSISIITADANVVVQAACWLPTQFPSYTGPEAR